MTRSLATAADDSPSILVGSAVRALDDQGRVGGVLVRLKGDPRETDTYGTFFDEETDFGFARDASIRSAVYYDHALGDDVKTLIGDGTISYRKLDDREELAIWVEAQLDRRHKYYSSIMELVEQGALSWSSGTLPNLIMTESVAGARRVTRWPLGLDASLTPVPSEFRETAIPLRSFNDALRKSQEPKMDPNATPVQPATAPATPPAIIVPPAGFDMAAFAALLAPALASAVTEGVRSAIGAPAGQAQTGAPAIVTAEYNVPQGVRHNRLTGLGDNEAKAFAYFVRTGDGRGAGMRSAHLSAEDFAALRASNATDMNVGTAADGGYGVPTGHFNGIVARRDESMLATKLGVRNIPGKGTTVNVPLDAEDDGEFVATNEASTSDLDAPALGQGAMTLVLYTKRVLMSHELLEDEDSSILAFLEDFVGRGMAKTHNSLLLTQVASGGTSFKTFASATAIAAGEPEAVVKDDNLGGYLDDSPSVSWVMRSSTHWTIKALTGNPRLYAGGGGEGKVLLGYPVAYSNKAAAIAAGAKDVFFGNWNFVGKREAPAFTVLRDPYSVAATGQIAFHYFFRTVYKVLQAEAIGYGKQATA